MQPENNNFAKRHKRVFDTESQSCCNIRKANKTAS